MIDYKYSRINNIFVAIPQGHLELSNSQAHLRFAYRSCEFCTPAFIQMTYSEIPLIVPV